MKRQAVIDDGLPYAGGRINQQCEKCGWTPQFVDLCEKEWCPSCGSQIELPSQIGFGGITVRDRAGCGFVLSENDGYMPNSVLLDGAEVHEALTFMARRCPRNLCPHSLPTLDRIRSLTNDALVAINHGHADLAKQTILTLLAELDPMYKGAMQGGS